jgi:hypothetical protein
MNRQQGVEGSLARILSNSQPPLETSTMPPPSLPPYFRWLRSELVSDESAARAAERIAKLASTIRARHLGEPDPYFTGGEPLQLIADLGGLVADLTAYELRRAMRPHLEARPS